MTVNDKFLPTEPWELDGTPDFVYVNGDAYVDHPSFGAAIISRVLESEGYTVAMLPQPDRRTPDSVKKFGKPRLAFLVSSGNIDSMVAHYTAAKKKRSEDYYSPGCKAGLRPDRAVIVYCNLIRQAYGDVPILIGGLEASLRRFAHYDYWTDKVRRSILVDSRADILMYGMGERSVVRLAELLDRGVPVKKIRDVRGTAYLAHPDDKLHFDCAMGFDEYGLPNGFTYDELKEDKKTYAEAFKIQYRNNDSVRGRAIVEYYDDKMLVVNPPQPPLEREELDKVYALPYTRTYHPMYEKDGGVPAISEVKFSVTHNRGCFGSCNFCAIAFHQGRAVRSRSIESCVEEARLITQMPDFKGYIHDVGGPTANFRAPACDKQLEHGVCADKKCLFPKPCPNLKVDHSEYIELLSAIEALPGVKKVFIRSGIRFDYLMADKSDAFMKKLVRDHVSGQLKVAPEHCAPNALAKMGKPTVEVYDKFKDKFARLSEECGKKQYLVPYLMSSHPGCTMDDAAELALYTKKIGLSPEQVQDFYPTPGTASTVMFYTGIDPFTGKRVYSVTDYREKQLQRALLQWRRPENRAKIREAMKLCSESGKKALAELIGMRLPGDEKSQKNVPEKKKGKDMPKEQGKKPKSSGKAHGKSAGKMLEKSPRQSNNGVYRKSADKASRNAPRGNGSKAESRAKPKNGCSSGSRGGKKKK